MLSEQGLGVRASHHFLNSRWRSDGQGVIASMNKKKRGKVHFFFGALHTYRPSKSYGKSL